MNPRYTATATLPEAIKAWSGKPMLSFPTREAPFCSIPGAPLENEVLADTFARLCALTTTTERTGFLMAAVEKYRRHIRLAESTIRGERNPRMVGANASRDAWASIRPIEHLIAALEQWRDELLDAWSAEIGIQFIDEAAKTRIAS